MLASLDETAVIPPIPGDWILQGGAVGLLAFVALLVFLGWLIPVRTYRSLERDRDHWRDVAMKATEQSRVLLPAAQIATEVTRALGGGARPDAAAQGDQS